MVHPRDKRIAVYQLAAALIVAALFAVAPAVWDVIDYLRFPDAVFVAHWAMALLLLCVIQLGYGVYLIQLPDWSSVWVVTLFSLAMAALYAMVLGLTLLSSTDGALVRLLQLTDKVEGGKAALWSLCMASLFTLLAFFAGRMSVRWRKAERMLTRAGLVPGSRMP
jgi:hypothetical protein